MSSYSHEPIAPAHIEATMLITMRAQNAFNMKLYSVIQIGDQARKDRLSETCGHSFIAEAPLVLLFLADMQRIYDFYRAFGVPDYCQEHDLEFETPQASNLMMSCCDALIAAQTSVIAAESLGIGSCYIGDIMGNHKEHQEMYQLPQWTFPIALLCYGYYPEDIKRKLNTRFDREFIWFEETYRHLSREDFGAMYGEIMEKFAGLLHRRNLNLAQLTYLNFTLGKSELEEQRSVAALLDRWISQQPAWRDE